ncbi:MAG: carbohydrate-binding domain-containing protein [Thermodesulfobacteriota bacterium]|nr:carbohydrate-binding domain-containing protein [Thermodesulfobacteriota bacterium]
MKKIVSLLLVLTLVFSLTACSGGSGGGSSDQDANGDSSDDEPSNGDSSEISYITLEGNSITIDGDGAVVDDANITITSAGTYSISGTLDDGQIMVNAGNNEKVSLILDGVDTACSTSAPIYVMNADKTVITLEDGTQNYVTDGNSYVFEDSESDEPNAAIFSKDDLTINGNGSLTVDANYNNGIQSKDDLKITGGNIAVYAVNDGLKGRDSIVVKKASITVNAGGDGLQSNNDEDSKKGYVSIESGTLNITAGQDGIQAETSLTISGGDTRIASGGGANSSSSSDSAKGLKAGVDITISGGTMNINSSDDSIHSNDSLRIDGGAIVLASGDDGIHSDSVLEIDGGDIGITKSYEGIESSIVTINDGDIHVVSSDDGINVAGGNDASSINGRPGQNNFDYSADHHLYINGGYIVINAAGDGIDVNGPINMTGGDVIINGPTSNFNGALDYYGDFKVSGGFLLAVGSSGMAQAPSTSSTQYSVMMTFPSVQSAGTLVRFEREEGEDVLTFSPTKAYQSVVLCSPELKNGSTYIVYSGGRSTGTATDGLYSGGTYFGGTQVTTFTISSVVTFAGSEPGGGFPGGPGGGMPPPGGLGG